MQGPLGLSWEEGTRAGLRLGFTLSPLLGAGVVLSDPAHRLGKLESPVQAGCGHYSGGVC